MSNMVNVSDTRHHQKQLSKPNRQAFKVATSEEKSFTADNISSSSDKKREGSQSSIPDV